MKLADYLPFRLRKGETLEFQEAIQPEIDLLSEYVVALPSEFSVKTAENWIGLYEWKYGLTVQPEKDLQYRRDRILAKMRGVGTTTLEMMQQVSAPYSEEPPEVIEDNPAYTFYIYLYNTSGYEPENLGDLRGVIEEIKPAHLDYQIIMLADIGTMDVFSGCLMQVTDTIEVI